MQAIRTSIKAILTGAVLLYWHRGTSVFLELPQGTLNVIHEKNNMERKDQSVRQGL